ncbi:MAG TPA: T9SS type A sorting domain-containing protein, partial [Candidatus Kapabacteria bacterium]|nr:T9SS type A sorting domain-containing protein [Candidatus Kapabacteria bacterium]
KSLYDSYYNPNNKISEMLYSDKPWWLYHLLYNVQNENGHIVFNYYRPKTGEEIRMLLNSSLIRGCKGFIYDGDENYHFPDCNAGNMGIGDGTRISAENDFFSNWVGADYIDNVNNTWNAYPYADLAALSTTMGVPENKVYIGTRSLRTELFNFHSKIRRADEELMKLRLVASYSKGFRVQQNHHPDYPDDSTFRRFLAWDEANNMVDTTRFKSWPIGRFHIYFIDDPFGPIGGTPVIEVLTEPWDSTFVDITLLKNVDTTINDLAYIGVQNRRTDPLIKINNNFQFFTTAEFEDSCDAVKNPDNYSTYRDLFYRRNGCRFVFLPFNHQNPADSTEYALLRITELGADSTYDSTWSYGRKMAFSTKIDTVIGQDRTLAIPFLPGEGKIFKVQVLHPDKNVYGYLPYSNQSKLVAYPDLDSNGNETSAYRYYLTYQNRQIFDSLGRTAVYFRRSKPISKNCLDENLVWEQELLVSDSILIDSNDVVARPCDYPSIVVRKDINGVLKAYIVYSCYKKNDKNMIAETILDLDNLDYGQLPIGVELSEYSGFDRSIWGNPVINASSNGNYYAWSDSTVGIVAAWKSPNNIYFNNPNSKISFKYNDDLGSEIKAQHPSLNVYSHLDNLEDNCSLVWEEHSNPTSAYRQDILYTRLKYNNSILSKYKANTYIGDSITFSIRNNIAKLSVIDSNVISRSFPVVSRSLSQYVINPSTLYANRQDIVYWQNNYNTTDSAGTYLMNCTIDLYDYNNQARKWRIYYPRYIKSAYRKVSSPNITQGYSLININGYESVGNSTTLNFWYNLYTPPGLADLSSQIGHLNVNNHSYVYSLYDSSYDAEDKWVRFVGNGYIPHLAKHKNFSNTLWQNRRVYQFHNISVYETQILTSAKYFYKGQSDEMLADWYIGFETADSTKKSFLFGAPELDEQRFSLKLPFEKVVSDEGYISFVETSSDTIASSWFSIESPKELALKLKGSKNANSKVYIQNKETERTLRLNLPNGLKDNKGAKAKYNLINGLGNEFRLLFVKNDDAMQYTEELWIEGLPIEEKPAGSFKVGDGIENIDLIQIVNRYYSESDISIFPNPASEVLYLQANVPFEEATLTVTNLLGTKVIQQQINLSKSPEIKLDISFLLPGIYYVNISDGLKSISGKFLKR